ncbi:MAG: PA2169 family four-helix-bundle protein [Prolixibacteraceae bacterium]
MDKQQLEHSLQKIVEICKDGVLGYGTAAENIKYDDLKTLFLRMSQQRKSFIEQLKNEALTMGVEINTSGSAKGFFHRTWLATKAIFSQDTNEKVIEESMNGEKAALDVYEQVMADPALPRYLKDILKDQQWLIKVAIQQLSSLKVEVRQAKS